MLARQHVKTVNDTAASIAEVLALLRTAGERRYDGEPVSHREHALQCATLALNQGQPAPLVAACLLHDVGHLLATSGAPDTPTLIGLDDRHQVRGPAWLAPLFPPEVLHPIRWHVDAKRFLAATDPAFLHALSADSRRSLALQGGPMDAPARARFLARPHAEDAVRLRRLDDVAKQLGLPTRPLETLAIVLQRCLRGGNGAVLTLRQPRAPPGGASRREAARRPGPRAGRCRVQGQG